MQNFQAKEGREVKQAEKPVDQSLKAPQYQEPSNNFSQDPKAESLGCKKFMVW